MGKKTLEELASLIEGEVIGDAGLKIAGISGIDEARKGQITFIAKCLNQIFKQ